MEAATFKASPGQPASDIPLQRNPPLAPSQELAYRNKCIQLKRRLNEIETNNDSTRKRIASEKERVQKMRLLRAILLNQLKEIMTTTGKSLSTEQLNKLGITETTELENNSLLARAEGETLLDDSSDESEDEEIPEPSERPTRMRRTNNNYRETVMNSSTSTSNNNNKAPLTTAASYAQTGLPNLAPAGTFTPSSSTTAVAAGSSRDLAGQQQQPSSFHVASTPLAAGAPAYSQHSPHNNPPYGADGRYVQHSSPIQQQQHQSLYSEQHRPAAAASASASAAQAAGTLPHESNGVNTNPPQLVRPIHPDAPFVQFQTHMRPQLEADSYPADQIEARIDEEWRKLSDENRGLWEQRYEEQMVEYQQDMNSYEHHRRRGGDYR